MAVEALRQLGGMYTNVVTAEQNLPLLSCNTCPMKFQTTSDLRVHNVSCKPQLCPSYRCCVCHETFHVEQEYNDHICVVTKLPCKYCYTYYVTKSDLEKHIQTNHSSDRPYKCNFCSLSFPRSSSLANHIKIHNYLPGRALLGENANKLLGPDPSNVATWSFEHVFVPEVSINDSWNYETNPLLSEDLNEGETINNQEIEFSEHLPEEENIDTMKSKLNSVKVETMSYGNDLETCLDDSFSITSTPQMEITIETDSKKPYVCSHCGISFCREKALVSHVKLHMIGCQMVHECEQCGEAFPDDQTKLQHKESCGFEQDANIQPSNKTKNINKNVKPQVKVGKYPCPDCDKHFTTKQKMYRHMWIHRKKTFTCELCAMTFELQSGLDKHRLSQHSSGSQYVCNECGKCFASRQGLWEHGRVHGSGSAGLFSCNRCNKTFASRQGYLIHQRTHTDERPYGCRFCLKAFRDGGTLRKHERIHTGYRPYVCPICSHDFNQKVVLREHVRWVHAANKTENENGLFVCQLCNVGISDREELCAHIVKHSDQLALEAKNTLKHCKTQLNSKVVENNCSSNIKTLSIKEVKSK